MSSMDSYSSNQRGAVASLLGLR